MTKHKHNKTFCRIQKQKKRTHSCVQKTKAIIRFAKRSLFGSGIIAFFLLCFTPKSGSTFIVLFAFSFSYYEPHRCAFKTKYFAYLILNIALIAVMKQLGFVDKADKCGRSC